MNRIYKFRLPDKPGEFTLHMPRSAQVLHVAMQGKTPCLWARVSVAAPPVSRMFDLVMTGEDLPSGRYLGMLLLDGGSYVLHLLELS